MNITDYNKNFKPFRGTFSHEYFIVGKRISYIRINEIMLKLW